MKIEDKIGLNAAKCLENTHISKGISSLQTKKLDIMKATGGMSDLIAPVGSSFAKIKNMIGAFLDKFTNAKDIVDSSKAQFMEKFSSEEILPKDLM